MVGFAADVHGGGAALDVAQLMVHEGARPVMTAMIRGSRFSVGRDDSCDLALPSDMVSRRHCTLVRRNDGWHVVDQSRFGTRIGSLMVEGEAYVPEGTEILVGPYTLRLFLQPSVSIPTQTRSTKAAAFEVVAEASDGAVVRAVLRVRSGPRAGQKIKLDRATTTFGGEGADVVLDIDLPMDALRLHTIRARVVAEPGSRPVMLGSHRLRGPTPVWEGEVLRVGDTEFVVDVDVMRADDEDVVIDGLIGRTPAMRHLRRALTRIARHDETVLLLGAPGTGKEAAARAIHEAGPRAGASFVSVNAGGIPEQLVESELFGHEAGAFSGASHRRPGLFHHAHGGTLFLDEIGELPLTGQAALLRALETGEVRRVGSVTPEFPDVRIVAATNRDLNRMVHEGTFREDLLHRLSVLTLGLPPLVARLKDLEELCVYLLERHHPGASISPAALEVLAQHTWPGNVRELRNVLTRAVVMAGPRILPESIVFSPVAFSSNVEASVPSVDEIEKARLAEALRRANGRKAMAARALGIPRTTLIYKLQKHGLG